MKNYFCDFPSLLRFSGGVISALNKTREGGKRDKSCESCFSIVMMKIMTRVFVMMMLTMMMTMTVTDEGEYEDYGRE